MNPFFDGIANALLLLALCVNQAQAPVESPGPEDAGLVKARSLLFRGLPTEAEHVTRAFLQEHPDSPDAHFLLGYILFREIQTDAEKDADVLRNDYQHSSRLPTKNQFHDAAARASLAEFTEGAKYGTPGAFDLKIVALDYVVLGDYPDADKWLTRSLQREPGDAQAWYYLGRAKYTENRFAEAIAAFEECLKRGSKTVQIEENLGLAYAGLGRSDEALAAYKHSRRRGESARLSSVGRPDGFLYAAPSSSSSNFADAHPGNEGSAIGPFPDFFQARVTC